MPDQVDRHFQMDGKKSRTISIPINIHLYRVAAEEQNILCLP